MRSFAASFGLDPVKQQSRRSDAPAAALHEIANGFRQAPASKPGGDLLFHCLGSSTIGAVRFHGRVRDGIGWVTDAMATKLWGQRKIKF